MSSKNMKGNLNFIYWPSGVLTFVWGYTGLEKLIQFRDSRRAFLNQPMPNELEEILAFAIPGVELLLALLLLFSASRWWGYLGSILLLAIFITYVGLIWVGAFPRVPCSCAGVLESLSWAEHFYFNLLLIGIAVLGLRLEECGSGGADWE
ncbi:MauE/DoxX family redox-associated membrane protein [Algoriphagus vanfongensis]|uniref:MauE/DoxX family redox-associated membrane protein n=1 Tax=Algoriphagus vanfongensis TaxID=426371 RepID=UPI0003F62EEB|nr:MauE/DoxX family redox-associated membrane protein [Algoriphagus vanfongensis]